LGNKKKDQDRLAGAGALLMGRYRFGSMQRASNPIFFGEREQDKKEFSDSKRKGVIQGNPLLLRQHLLRNPNIVTSIGASKLPSAGPLQIRPRGGSVQVKHLREMALLAGDGETKYSKYY